MRRNSSNSGVPLDALDRRILREVQRDCSITAAQLAERCGTTDSTALRRLNRLRREGFIRAEVALVDGRKVGRGLLIFVNVRLEREDSARADAFVDRIAGHPDVMQFYFVTGGADYVIMLSVRSMEDYDNFVRANLVSNPLVIMSETIVVVRPLKMSLSIPMEP